jgi:hypothetical protein
MSGLQGARAQVKLDSKLYAKLWELPDPTLHNCGFAVDPEELARRLLEPSYAARYWDWIAGKHVGANVAVVAGDELPELPAGNPEPE